MPQSPAAHDPEPTEPPADPAELAAERDMYAAEAHALRRQLADANTREAFLHAAINDLRAARSMAGPHPAHAERYPLYYDASDGSGVAAGTGP